MLLCTAHHIRRYCWASVWKRTILNDLKLDSKLRQTFFFTSIRAEAFYQIQLFIKMPANKTASFFYFGFSLLNFLTLFAKFSFLIPLFILLFQSNFRWFLGDLRWQQSNSYWISLFQNKAMKTITLERECVCWFTLHIFLKIIVTWKFSVDDNEWNKLISACLLQPFLMMSWMKRDRYGKVWETKTRLVLGFVQFLGS